MNILRSSIAVLAISGMCFALAGCGDSGGPDPKAEEVRLNKNLEMRKLFEKSGGDYTKLDVADKTTMDKLAGGEAAAKDVFDMMKKGPGGGPSGPPAGTPQ